MPKIEMSKECCLRMAALEGNAGIGVGGGLIDYERRKDAVFVAAHQADHRYDGAAPDSQNISRAEYVGRAVLAALNA